MTRVTKRSTGLLRSPALRRATIALIRPVFLHSIGPYSLRRRATTNVPNFLKGAITMGSRMETLESRVLFTVSAVIAADKKAIANQQGLITEVHKYYNNY